MNLEPVIGLEIHIQLKTKSKMFCSCANIFGDVKPNSAICPICLGYPGTLPVPNKTAIEWTQLAGAALGCELAAKSKFDRKSYFYPDLPKGYQISQYDQPFCGRGELLGVGITRIHLEEDAAKNIHPEPTSAELAGNVVQGSPDSANYTLVDFNRAGTPLMEIVTEPDINSPRQAREFLQELQRIMRALGVSDANMEKGQMRCDANVSLRPAFAKASAGKAPKLYPKTEIKNINSFRFVQKALQYEIERQTKVWQESGAPKKQSTRGFNSRTGKTNEQRTKEEAADYRYFPEPDIPPFEFSAKELQQRKVDLPELPHAKEKRLQDQFQINRELANLLIAKDLADLFEQTSSELRQLINENTEITPTDEAKLISLAGNIITRHLPADFSKMTPANFAELVVLVHQGAVNKSSLQPILAEMQRTGGDPDHIIKNLGLEQISDDAELAKIVQQVINRNPEIAAKIRAGKDAAIQALVGQVMAATGGQANPAKVVELIRQHL